MKIFDVNTLVTSNYGDLPPKFKGLWETQVAELKKKFAGSIEETHMPGEFPTDILTVFISKNALLGVCEYIKVAPGFEYGFLSDLTATDETPNAKRFEVVYHFFSHTTLARIRLKVRVAEGELPPSLHQLWTGATWAEREVYDMFGIRFEGHPDMRRILMDVRWEGHPLRKDYDLKGYQIFPTPEPVNPDLLK